MSSFSFLAKGCVTMRLAALWSCVALTCLPAIADETSVGSSGRPAPDEKILFVGNSLIYTNNVPALYAALSGETFPDKPISVDMVASGGASIADWSGDERLKKRIFQNRYQTIILQERGGPTLCVLDDADRAEPECARLITAHLELAEWSRRTGARLYYLGTYQKLPKVSKSLVESEKWISEEIGAEYIEFSETWHRVRLQHPDLPWLDADNFHPGMSTSLLYAVRIFQAIHHRLPVPVLPCTPYALYKANGFSDKYVHMEAVVASVGSKVTCIEPRDGLAEILADVR